MLSSLPPFPGQTDYGILANRNGEVIFELILKPGDLVRIDSNGDNAIVLRNRLSYADGVYSYGASFLLRNSSPPSRIVLESWYGVVKRMRVSPGALVLEVDESSDHFSANAKIVFRDRDRDQLHELKLNNVPEWMAANISMKSQGAEVRLSSSADPFYEYVWNVMFRIDREQAQYVIADQVMHGELEFAVLNSTGSPVASKTLAFNVKSVFDHTEFQVTASPRS